MSRYNKTNACLARLLAAPAPPTSHTEAALFIGVVFLSLSLVKMDCAKRSHDLWLLQYYSVEPEPKGACKTRPKILFGCMYGRCNLVTV